MLACAGLCACSSDDIDLTSGTQKVFEGDKAYVAVRIKDVGSSTRATSPTGNEAFGEPISGEYDVSDAYFYFYDEYGLFVSEGEVWDGTDGTTYPGAGTGIDFKSAKTIILKGLTEKNYPKYVVTVLNKPKDFKSIDNLHDLLATLADEEGVGIKTEGKFVMSTTSFADQKNQEGTKMPYCVTELKTENFQPEPIDDIQKAENPVDIYVERLAAKVTVDVSDDLKEKAEENDKGNLCYSIEETVGGLGNSDVVDQDDEGAEQLYISILGWKLNATARHSNILKNIDETWTDDYLNFTAWNDITNHRSYWGKSFNYDKTPKGGEYPTAANGQTEADENGDGTKGELNEYLKYVSLEDKNDYGQLLELGAYDYCAENTNTATNSDQTNKILKHKNSSAITSVLLKAQICHKNADGGWEYPTLVRYDGELFTEDEYEDYILQLLTYKGSINLYYRESAQDPNIKRVNHRFAQLKDMNDMEGIEFKDNVNYDGCYGIEFVPNQELDPVLWYKRIDEKDFNQNQGDITDGKGFYYSPISVTEVAKQVQGVLDEFNLTAEANGYKDGLMYYNIPIQHLNNEYVEEHNTETGKVIASVKEANYGVVRNHWYQITINDVANLGKGITDEKEVIIPDPDDLETYYVGAEINILSWKIVEQGVSL